MNPKTASRVPAYTQERPRPVPFDHCLRYWVWSHTEPGKKYLVQLDSYNMNGECQCGNFAFNLEKHLKVGLTPEAAVEKKLVKLKERQRPEDALRCLHIVDAFMTFAEDAGRSISDAEKKNTPPPKREP